MDTVIKVLSDEPVPPRRLNASIPRDLETICLKCLEKDPRRRYGAARAVGAAERTVKWVKRRPVIAALSASVVVTALLGLSGIVWQWREAVAARINTSRAQEAVKRLESIRTTITDLEERQRDEYTVSVVSAPGRQSGFERYFTDREGSRVSGYYLIVEAKKPDGTVVPRRIHNRETGRDEQVTTWAERVPKPVYDRLAKDKREDGILDETTFAVKHRGFADEQITMPGPDGKPLTRMGEITKW
jgi:hypothetical protein